MRHLALGRVLVPAVLAAACGADAIQAPMPIAAPSMGRSAAALPPSYEYETFAVPGAILTVAQGVNARGDIVGFFDDAGRRRHGFLLRDGLFATIDIQGAVSTDARGIGPDGDIVGGYRRAGEPGVNIHGYQLTAQGDTVPVNYPGHTNTIPQRILPNGTILGCRHDQDTMGSMRGIVMGRHANEELNAFASMNNGATPDGRRIAGLYTDMANRTAGYVVEDGVFTPFFVPGSDFTAAWDINPAAQITGVYRDAASRFHGFVRSGDEYATLDVPGAAATRAFGINARGAVVGSYVASGVTRAFIATPAR